MNVDESAVSKIVDIRSALSVRARGERVERVLALGVVLVLVLVAVITWLALADSVSSGDTGPTSPSISVSSL